MLVDLDKKLIQNLCPIRLIVFIYFWFASLRVDVLTAFDCQPTTQSKMHSMSRVCFHRAMK